MEEARRWIQEEGRAERGGRKEDRRGWRREEEEHTSESFKEEVDGLRGVFDFF
jgi:hypothetical protein